MRYVFIILLAACGPRYGYVAQTYPWQVRIVAPIPQGEPLTKVTCELSERPKPPEPLTYEGDDVMYRTTVHTRDFNDLIAYDRDMAVYSFMIERCLRKLVRANKNLEVVPVPAPPINQLPSNNRPPVQFAPVAP